MQKCVVPIIRVIYWIWRVKQDGNCILVLLWTLLVSDYLGGFYSNSISFFFTNSKTGFVKKKENNKQVTFIPWFLLYQLYSLYVHLHLFIQKQMDDSIITTTAKKSKKKRVFGRKKSTHTWVNLIKYIYTRKLFGWLDWVMSISAIYQMSYHTRGYNLSTGFNLKIGEKQLSWSPLCTKFIVILVL